MFYANILFICQFLNTVSESFMTFFKFETRKKHKKLQREFRGALSKSLLVDQT